MNISSVTQKNLQTALPKIENLPKEDQIAPLLNGANVKVSAAPLDIERLASKLELETNDESEKVAKKSVGSSFSTIIARVAEKASIDESNMQVLDEASHISDEIDAIDKEVEQYQKQIDTLTQKLHEEEREVSGLKSKLNSIDKKLAKLDVQIAAETDPAKKAQLEAQKEELLNEKTDVSSQLSTARAKLSMTQQIIGETAEKVAEKMREKDVKKEELKKKLEELKDKELLDEIIKALRDQKQNVTHLIEEKKAERSDAEEKYLEENAPIEVIRRMLDEIEEQREEKI